MHRVEFKARGFGGLQADLVMRGNGGDRVWWACDRENLSEPERPRLR